MDNDRKKDPEASSAEDDRSDEQAAHCEPEEVEQPQPKRRGVVDEASRESFPASDPPAFTPGKLG